MVSISKDFSLGFVILHEKKYLCNLPINTIIGADGDHYPPIFDCNLKDRINTPEMSWSYSIKNAIKVFNNYNVKKYDDKVGYMGRSEPIEVALLIKLDEEMKPHKKFFLELYKELETNSPGKFFIASDVADDSIYMNVIFYLGDINEDKKYITITKRIYTDNKKNFYETSERVNILCSFTKS